MLFPTLRQQGAVLSRRATAVNGTARGFARSAARQADAAQEAANAAKKGANEAASAAKQGANEAANAAKQVGEQGASAAKEGVEAAKQAADKGAAAAKSGVDAAKSQLSGAADKAREIGGAGLKRFESMFGAYSEPVVYNLKVAGAIAKQVYQAERLAPPTSIGQITSAYQSLWARASDAGYWSKFVSSGEWKKVGIYAVEAMGIFTIGEMIGRRSIVGYKLDTSGHHHSGAH